MSYVRAQCHTQFNNFSRFIKTYIKKCYDLQVHLTFSFFHTFILNYCCFQSSIISILTLFGAAHGWQKDSPLSKMSHTYLAMMKLRTAIPYLMKIQKHLNHLEQPLIFDFFIGNLQILLYQEMQILIAFLYIISNSFNIF